MKKAYLLLADGTRFTGWSIGAEGTAIGETVFTTGMGGYLETLTDPSFCGQLVTQTYPLIGNYGVNREDMESDRTWLKGYIVRELCDAPSNFRMQGTLREFLTENGIVGIAGIDTRKLTRILREDGVMNGAITTDSDGQEALFRKIRDYETVRPVAQVTCREPYTVKAENPVYQIALLDAGCKKSIISGLVKRGCTVKVFPAGTSAQEILNEKPNGILLSNGPGDPLQNPEMIGQVKILLHSGIPILGICLGHQLMAVAAGALTEKLKFGHRGENHPVKDIALNRIFVTSQNHGYAILQEGIEKSAVTVTHVSMNDNTVEGLRYNGFPAMSVQFHPEAAPGPEDTEYIFEQYMDLVKHGRMK